MLSTPAQPALDWITNIGADSQFIISVKPPAHTLLVHSIYTYDISQDGLPLSVDLKKLYPHLSNGPIQKAYVTDLCAKLLQAYHPFAVLSDSPATFLMSSICISVALEWEPLTASISFNPAVISLLEKIRARYSMEDYTSLISFKGKYTAPLFNAVLSFKNTIAPDGATDLCFRISTQTLKQVMDAEIYERFFDFRVNALDKAIDEINDISSLFLEYELSKTRQRFTDVIFKIKKQNGGEKDV